MFHAIAVLLMVSVHYVVHLWYVLKLLNVAHLKYHTTNYAGCNSFWAVTGDVTIIIYNMGQFPRKCKVAYIFKKVIKMHYI